MNENNGNSISSCCEEKGFSKAFINDGRQGPRKLREGTLNSNCSGVQSKNTEQRTSKIINSEEHGEQSDQNRIRYSSN